MSRDGAASAALRAAPTAAREGEVLPRLDTSPGGGGRRAAPGGV